MHQGNELIRSSTNDYGISVQVKSHDVQHDVQRPLSSVPPLPVVSFTEWDQRVHEVRDFTTSLSHFRGVLFDKPGKPVQIQITMLSSVGRIFIIIIVVI